jgi:hypothetical protein
VYVDGSVVVLTGCATTTEEVGAAEYVTGAAAYVTGAAE